MSNIDPSKIKKDIDDLKDKKQTLLLSLQNDVDEIDAKITKEFCEIGMKAYYMSVSGEDSLSQLNDFFTKVSQFKSEQEAKNKKMNEITERYDDEITMLEKSPDHHFKWWYENLPL